MLSFICTTWNILNIFLPYKKTKDEWRWKEKCSKIFIHANDIMLLIQGDIHSSEEDTTSTIYISKWNVRRTCFLRSGKVLVQKEMSKSHLMTVRENTWHMKRDYVHYFTEDIPTSIVRAVFFISLGK